MENIIEIITAKVLGKTITLPAEVQFSEIQEAVENEGFKVEIRFAGRVYDREFRSDRILIYINEPGNTVAEVRVG